MKASDWFRNTTWDEKTAEHFESRLKRARGNNKSQYIRIQAHTLAQSHPAVALSLLDRYFTMPINLVGRSQAYVDQAAAYISIGKMEQAVASYQSALEQEKEFKNSLTQAYVELPYIITAYDMSPYYDLALKTLEEHRERPVFPIEHFKRHAAYAFVLFARGRSEEAKLHADKALRFSDESSSSFPKHPTVGLVSKADYSHILSLLRTVSERGGREK